jgi:hypothetical protein
MRRCELRPTPSTPTKKTKSKKHPDSACSGAEHLVEAGGLQSGASRASREFGDRVWVGGVYAAGLVQSCGFEYRWAACHYVGEQVTASIGGPTYHLVGGGGAGEFDRIGEVDGHLEHLRFGFENRGQPGDEILRGKKPPALTQMQPTGGCALGAALEP